LSKVLRPGRITGKSIMNLTEFISNMTCKIKSDTGCNIFRLLVLVVILKMILLTNFTFSQEVNPSRIFNDDSTSREILSELIEIAWENYPKNRVFQHLINYAEEKRHQEHLSWFNTLNITWQYNPMYEFSGESIGVFPRFGLGFIINVGEIITTPSRIAQADEEVLIAEANMDNQRNYIEAEVIRRYYRYLENLELLEVHSQTIEDTDLLMKMIKNRFQQGEVNLETYTRALDLYSSSRENMAKTKGKVMNSKYSLEEILGVELEKVL